MQISLLPIQYLSGHVNANGTTLVKVIAAVLKFTPQQTQLVLDKEIQRHTLVSLKDLFKIYNAIIHVFIDWSTQQHALARIIQHDFIIFLDVFNSETCVHIHRRKLN